MNETQIAIARIDVMMSELKLMKAKLIEADVLATDNSINNSGIEARILDEIKAGKGRTAIIRELSSLLCIRRINIQVALEQMIANGVISRDMTKRKNNAHIYIIN